MKNAVLPCCCPAGHEMRVHRGPGQPQRSCMWKPSSRGAGGTRIRAIRRLLPSAPLHGARSNPAILRWAPDPGPSICSMGSASIHFPFLYFLVSGVPGMASFSCIESWYTLPVLNCSTPKEETRYFCFYILGAHHGVGSHQRSDSIPEPITAPNYTSH